MRAKHKQAQRGITMVFAILFMLLVAVLSVAIINFAGRDRIAAARMSVQERGLACADAGIQYGRRYFGCSYKDTGGWNSILDGTEPGRYDTDLGDTYPTSVGSIDRRLKGDRFDSGTLEPGTDLDGDGQADFWVSIRDDDDDRSGAANPAAAGANVRTHDNNLSVILRAECINPAWAADYGGLRRTAVIEVLLTYLPGTVSEYGKATSSSDFPEASASGPTVASPNVTAVENKEICDLRPAAPGSAG